LPLLKISDFGYDRLGIVGAKPLLDDRRAEVFQLRPDDRTELVSY
jgi:hypothetical protein